MTRKIATIAWTLAVAVAGFWAGMDTAKRNVGTEPVECVSPWVQTDDAPTVVFPEWASETPVPETKPA